MLTIYESEKIAIAQKLLQKVKSEIEEKDLSKEILLGDAIAAIDEIIQQNLPDYTPPKEEAWYTPEGIRELMSEPTMSDTQSVSPLGYRILSGLSVIRGYSIVFAGLIACLSLGHWGMAEVCNTNLRVESELKSQSRSYLGISAIFLSVTAGSVLLATRVEKGDE